MCVTSAPAMISGTQTYVYATTDPDGRKVHVCGYQNLATRSEGANCMFLNFAGNDLEMVEGPELTRHMMRNMTAGLEELEYVPRMRGGGSYGAKGYSVQSYGDYTVVLAQRPEGIMEALESDEILKNRRPIWSPQLHRMANFYVEHRADDTFVLACFDGSADPRHPIVVSYTPYDADVLTIPGLDAHDGSLPVIGAPVYRGFKVAFGIEGVESPHKVHYDDSVEGLWWAPRFVAGFDDNRQDGPNGEYVVPVSAVRAGLTANRLAEQLVAPLS